MPISHKKSRVVKRFLQKKVRDKSRIKEKKSKPAVNSKGPAYTLSTEIPERYDDNYMRAIPRDPQNFYVYWEVSQKKIDEKKTSGKDYAPENNFLQIQELIPRDTAQTAYRKKHESQLPAVPMEISTKSQDSLYFKVPHSGKDYLIEYGNRDEKQGFSPTTSAPVISIPRTGMSTTKTQNPNIDTELLTNLSFGTTDLSASGTAESLPYMSSPHYSSGENIQR